MPRKIKLVIADDHELIRKGYRSLLEDEGDIMVVGETDNGKALLQLLKTQQVHVILLDLEMPVMNGEETLKVIVQRYPDIAVIILSQYYSESLVAGFLGAGARAYLPKNCKVDDFLDAIYAVSTDGYYLNAKTSVAVLNSFKKEKVRFAVYDKLALSDREIEVLKLLSMGKRNREIALLLNLTASTIDFHRRNVYRKTNCKTTAQLVMYAVQQGLIEVPKKDFSRAYLS